METEVQKITEVKGTITMADGSTSEFRIFTDGGWSQWGANTVRLAETGVALDAMANALMDDDLLASDADGEDKGDE